MTSKPPAIDAISDEEEIRVVIFVNGTFVHAPLPALVKHLLDRIEALEQRVEDLENA